MSDCKKYRSLFLEAFYEELENDLAELFKEHMQLCSQCRSKFDEMSSTLRFMSQRVRPEPEESYWDSYEERLAQRIKKEENALPKESFWRRRFSTAFHSIPRWAYQSAAAVILIVVGIFVGRMIFFSPVSEVQQISQQQPGIQLTSRAHSYIERSKLILLALVNFDPAVEDPYALDLPNQQQISRQLVQEASLLKRDLAASDQKRLQNLIADLEVILLQIANLESENDFEAIELLKDGVNTKGILMEINLSSLRKSMNKGKNDMPLEKPLRKPVAF